MSASSASGTPRAEVVLPCDAHMLDECIAFFVEELGVRVPAPRLRQPGWLPERLA